MQRFKKWTETHERLLRADLERTLEPKELEDYALSAYLTGRYSESFLILERAHKGYLNQEKTKQAVRCIFWLSLMLMEAGEKARSGGWIARGERLLKDEQSSECAEKGLLMLLAALEALYGGNSALSQKLFQQGASMGEQFGDADLIALGRLGHGQAMIQQGKIAKGIKLLDETMITIETEAVFPIACGIIYCAAIESCRKIWDMQRAQEWTSALTRWCEAQPDIVSFRGQCLVRRAEILQFHGEWSRALEETKTGCEMLERQPGEPAAGEAYYRKAELLRLLGNFDQAEDCYHEASKWGRTPQPGLALLRLAQGQDDAAETSIRNTLKGTKDTKRGAELLPAVVHIMIAVKKTKEAIVAMKELSGIANEFDAPYLIAKSAYCQGTIFLAEGSFQPALEHLQKALELWNTLHLPYESARTRELKGMIYQKLQDKDNAYAEFEAAKWVFEQLKAKPDLERINQLFNTKRFENTYGLTLRELQVLHRVATGNTNKIIAGELFISERTVDRHVSNIFNKLGVSSRVEATTFALRNNILNQKF